MRPEYGKYRQLTYAEAYLNLQHSDQSIRQFEEDALLFADVSPKISYKISSIDAGIRMADAGYGVAFTLQSYLQEFSNAENLHVFSVGDQNLTIPFSAIRNFEKAALPEIRKWIALTEEFIRKY